MAYNLLGKNFVPPDVYGKVTGKARYAEDFRRDGMVHCRLLSSPMPHARVRNIDVSDALAMPGVIDVLTADDVPQLPGPELQLLTNEPMYIGQPILAVAAVDETTAADAIDAIRIDFEELPFTVDPLESLFPGGPDARTDGNVIDNRLIGPPRLKSMKWTAADFASVDESQLPTGEPLAEWSYGDLDAAFAQSALVLDETFVTSSMAHHSMEPRSAMAYWENGKCFVYGSSQSQSFIVPDLARFIGVDIDDLVYIAETCGGGFGSKATAYPLMAIPAHMSKKIGRPVLMRVSRAEEYFNGKARTGFQGRIKLGFAPSGRVLAADVYVVQENGPTTGFPDWPSSGDTVSALYQPTAMRWRGLAVQTNTPPRDAQRGPGHNQTVSALEPIIDKAARQLGLSQLEIRQANTPPRNAQIGGDRVPVTSCYLKEALAQAVQEFNWVERSARSGERNGSKVRGYGIGQAYHPAGFTGFDGLVRIMPDGKLHIHTGVGNLGTYSHSGTSRIAAEVLKYDWDNCVVERGDTRKHLPWNLAQFGSNTSFTMARTNFVAATDALAKIREIAAMDLGGAPEDYDVENETVFNKASPDQRMTYAEVAQRAIELGGRFDGHEMADDMNPMTKTSVTALAGTGLIGAARDNLPITGAPGAFVVGMAEIELDLETGEFDILDYLGVADCGTVIHPQGLATQVKGGAVMGIGMASLEHHIYDPQNGLPGAVGLYQAKPATFLDVPSVMRGQGVDQPDPQSPLGTKGVGEPVMGAASSAVVCAISDALGGHYFNRVPVTTDQIINAASGRAQSHKPLQVNTA